MFKPFDAYHVLNAVVRKLDTAHYADEEALMASGVHCDLYDITVDGRLHENIAVYASWVGNHRAPEAEPDWTALRAYLRLEHEASTVATSGTAHDWLCHYDGGACDGASCAAEPTRFRLYDNAIS